MKTFILKLEKEDRDISVVTFDLDKQEIVKIRGEEKFYLEGTCIEGYWEKIKSIKSILKNEKINIVLLIRDKSLFFIAEKLDKIIENKMKISIPYKMMDSYVKQVCKIREQYMLDSINEIENYFIFKNNDTCEIRIKFYSIGGIDFTCEEELKENKALKDSAYGDLLAAYLAKEYADYFI